ncbi:MAG: GntR family transcriptional regulator [Ilumatobacteraceae bacterium]
MVAQPALLALDRPQRSYELVYERLRRAVLDGTFPPGSRLVEADLADRLQVSRTPVREALRRLESDGFAQRVRGGLVITPSGPDDLGDIGLLRIEIDGLAARLAASRGSKADWADLQRRIEALRAAPDAAALAEAHLDVHRAIYAIGFSPRMSTFFENHLLTYVAVSVSPGPGDTDDDPEASYRQHMQLLAAYSSGDPERAARAARQHAEGGLKVAAKRAKKHGLQARS